MQKITLRPLAICRTPVFPLDTEMKTVWHELKGLIRDASPGLHEIIKDHQYHDLEDLPLKVRFSVWKYFNRARFRATPFGKFGSFTVLPISVIAQLKKNVTIDSNLKLNEFVDWSLSEKTYDYSQVKFLKTNSSVYRHADEIRFIKMKSSHFQLSSIEYNELAYNVLEFSQAIKSIDSLKNFLREQGLEQSSVDEFIEQLIRIQLLVTDMHPNVIGEDFFFRTSYNALPVKINYIIAERIHRNGNLEFKDLKILNEVAHYLFSTSTSFDSNDLKQFKVSFRKRFENKQVSLLDAIDPEAGVAYGNSIQELEEDELISQLKDNRDSLQPIFKQYLYSDLTKNILNKIFLNQPVKLEDFKLENKQNERSLPNTFSAIIEFIDGRILLKSMGGATATSLIGRFTLASKDLQMEARSLVEAEESANSDVLFFDIAYQGEKNVDNINRRQSIYNFESPILTWSNSKQIIDLSDIVIGLEGDELILFSRKYGKRIVPRLASAYNYVRSDLPLFRLLTDLQSQNLHTNLSVDISSQFAGLEFYPRVTYKNVIISPAKWLIPKSLYNHLSTTVVNNLIALREWLTSKAIGNSFICKDGDQSLLFLVDSNEDLSAFLLYAKTKNTLYIEEAFQLGSSKVQDENNKQYAAEFIVNFVSPKQIYRPSDLKFESLDKVTSLFLPGDDWLYYEIYCHPFRSNEILLSFISPFISSNEQYIEKYFFIRYNDPSYHIRLRIKLNNSADIGLLMNRFNNESKSWVESAKISEVQMKSYNREVERYGKKNINKIEQIFNYDSKIVLSILSEQMDSITLYKFSVHLIEEVLFNTGLTLHTQLIFVKEMASNYVLEHKVNRKGLKLINRAYRNELRTGRLISIGVELSILTTRLKNSILETLKSYKGKERKKLLADIFHMHVNRLFHKDQRLHEMVIYEFLQVRYQSKVSINKSNLTE